MGKTKNQLLLITLNFHKCKSHTTKQAANHTEWLSDAITVTDVTDNLEQWSTWMEAVTSSAANVALTLSKRWNLFERTRFRTKTLNCLSNLSRHQEHQSRDQFILKFSQDQWLLQFNNNSRDEQSLHSVLEEVANQMATLSQSLFLMGLAWMSLKYKLSPVTWEDHQWILVTWTISTWTLIKKAEQEETYSKDCSPLECQCSSCKVTKNNHRAAVSVKSTSIIYHLWRLEKKLIAIFASRKSVQTEIKAVNYHVATHLIKAALANGWKTTIIVHAAE